MEFFNLSNLYLHDDFTFGANGSGSVGALNWGVRNIVAAPAIAYQANSTLPNPGVLRITTGATSGNGGVVVADISGASVGQLGILKNWSATYVFRTVDIASVTTRVGFSISAGSASTPPTDGFWLKFDTATSDTNYKFECRASSTSTIADSNVNADATKFHKLVITPQGGGIAFSLDGQPLTVITTNISANSVGLSPFIQIVTNATATKAVDVDYFDFKMWDIER